MEAVDLQHQCLPIINHTYHAIALMWLTVQCVPDARLSERDQSNNYDIEQRTSEPLRERGNWLTIITLT